VLSAVAAGALDMTKPPHLDYFSTKPPVDRDAHLPLLVLAFAAAAATTILLWGMAP
jgi:hypothetical protein